MLQSNTNSYISDWKFRTNLVHWYMAWLCNNAVKLFLHVNPLCTDKEKECTIAVPSALWQRHMSFLQSSKKILSACLNVHLTMVHLILFHLANKRSQQGSGSLQEQHIYFRYLRPISQNILYDPFSFHFSLFHICFSPKTRRRKAQRHFEVP